MPCNKASIYQCFYIFPNKLSIPPHLCPKTYLFLHTLIKNSTTWPDWFSISPQLPPQNVYLLVIFCIIIIKVWNNLRDLEYICSFIRLFYLLVSTGNSWISGISIKNSTSSVIAYLFLHRFISIAPHLVINTSTSSAGRNTINSSTSCY